MIEQETSISASSECQGAFHVKCTAKMRQGFCVVRRKNGQLVELVILYARKGGGCKGTGPPDISINVV